jgi:HD-GYP domain-containing protein (c-di-GMP phosphodiesterase class II)
MTGLQQDPASQGEKGVWQVLERFLHSLQVCRQLADMLTPSLDAVFKGSGADVAFWYSRSTERVSGLVGSPGLSPPVCAKFVARLLADLPAEREELLWTNPSFKPEGTSHRPHSAVLARLGKSSNWVVAISLNPDRPLRTEHLGFVRVVQHMLLTYHSQVHAKIKDVLAGLIQCLTTALEAKDTYTAGHSERVARIGVVLAKQMGLPSVSVSDVYLAGLIHDIGKIGVQDTVLQKAGALTEADYAHIQEHPVIGDRIISTIPQFNQLRPGVRNHHEHYDGNGYPDGLAGEKIPLVARILGIADACDAMLSPRRYRPARTPPQIDAIFREQAGKQFDPGLVEQFMACRDQIYPPIYQKGLGESAFHAIDQIIEGLRDGSLAATPALSLPEEEEMGPND